MIHANSTMRMAGATSQGLMNQAGAYFGPMALGAMPVHLELDPVPVTQPLGSEWRRDARRAVLIVIGILVALDSREAVPFV